MQMDWIEQKKIEQDRTKESAQAEIDRALFAAHVLQKEAPAFWSELTSALRSTVSRLEDIGVRGTVSDTSTNIENACQIAVSLTNGLYPQMTHTNVFYRNGDLQIRCTPLDVSPYTLAFQVSETRGIGVVPSDGHTQLNVAGAAERIVRPMVERIQARR
jgi:hypothetical protein